MKNENNAKSYIACTSKTANTRMHAFMQISESYGFLPARVRLPCCTRVAPGSETGQVAVNRACVLTCVSPPPRAT